MKIFNEKLLEKINNVEPSEKLVLKPEILLHPQIPKPLHTLAPRVVLGKLWWDQTRKEAYKSTNYHCIVCGVHKTRAKYHKWLEAHEVYKIDYEKGRLTYIETVPLCHSCHNYIHVGRMEYLVSVRKMEVRVMREIVCHGNRILKEAKLLKKKQNREKITNSADWKDWRLVVFGKEYGPAFKSYDEWKAYHIKGE